MSHSIQLTATYTIHAAHKLYRDDWSVEKNSAVFGHCARLHGHQYKLEVTVNGKIPEDSGMLINGYDLDKIVGEKILAQADHRYLNDDVEFFKTHQSTAEWIAVWAFEELKNALPAGVVLQKVRIFETPELVAEYGN